MVEMKMKIMKIKISLRSLCFLCLSVLVAVWIVRAIQSKTTMSQLLKGTSHSPIKMIEIESAPSERNFVIEDAEALKFMESCFHQASMSTDDGFVNIHITMRIHFANGASYKILNAGFGTHDSCLRLSIPESNPIEYGCYTHDVYLDLDAMPPGLRELWITISEDSIEKGVKN